MTHGRPPRRELWKVHSASFGSASDRSPAGAFSSARRRRWTAWGCRAFLPRARGAAVGPGSQADTHWRPPTCISGNPRPLQPRWKLTCITASLCAMTLPRRGPGRCSSPSSPRGAPPWTTPAQEHLSVREGPRNATSRQPKGVRGAQYPCPQTSEYSTALATTFGIEGGSQAKGNSLPMYHGLQDERLQKRMQPGPHRTHQSCRQSRKSHPDG